jgi:hypothetical protein
MLKTKVDDLLHLLCWSGRLDLAESMFNVWVTALSDQLGSLLGDIVRDDVIHGEQLLERVRGLTDAGFMRILTSPAASDRLLWPERHKRQATSQWLLHAVDMEQAIADGGDRLNVTGWTALGDAEITGEQIVHVPRVGCVPIDWDSPDARAIDAIDSSLWEDISMTERRDIVTRTEKALDALGTVNPDGQSIVMSFTRVLMLQKRSGMGFRTRSPERRIGLSLFQNPHLLTVDNVDLAEGLVHEAIHSILDIDERLRQLSCPPEKQWVKDPKLYDGASRILSPWTGTPLALPTFLQACFVWFGLLHHWCLFLPTNIFDRNRVKSRIAQCASGFLCGALVNHLGEYRDAVGAEIQDALNQMQHKVAQNFAAIAN